MIVHTMRVLQELLIDKKAYFHVIFEAECMILEATVSNSLSTALDMET